MIDGFDIRSKDELSVRAKNIYNDFGSMEMFVQYYLNNGNFLNVRNSGRKTNAELCSLAKNIQRYFTNVVQKTDEVDVIHLKGFSDLYKKSKESLSNRAQNILNAFERFREIDQEEYDQASVESLLKSKINFLDIRNCGVTTKVELDNFIEEFVSTIQEQDIVQAKIAEQPVFNSLRKIFPDISAENVLTSFYDDEGYDLLAFTCIFIQRLAWKEKTKRVIKMVYFQTDELDIDDIAREVGLTRERVRQVKKKVEGTHISESLRFLKSRIKGTPFGFPFNEFGQYFIQVETKVLANYSSFLVSKLMIFRIAEKILENDYFDLSMVLRQKEIVLRTLAVSKNTYLVSNDFERITSICDFLVWADDEIYNLKKLEIEFTRSVLVSRYFIQLEKIVDPNLIEACARLLEALDCGFVVPKSKFHEVRIFKQSVLLHSERIIRVAGHPIKTIVILEELSLLGIKIARVNLLSILNKSKNRVTQFGNGMWALTEWKEDGMLSGSIRDMVHGILEASDEPVHISEILDVLIKYRTLSERNLITNLRLDDYQRFVFFNCMFIGLSDRVYNSKWANLPRINGKHFDASALKKAANISNEGISAMYERKYGYPRIHVEYLISAQKKNLDGFSWVQNSLFE